MTIYCNIIQKKCTLNLTSERTMLLFLRNLIEDDVIFVFVLAVSSVTLIDFGTF
jgi:hypothetical protein